MVSWCEKLKKHLELLLKITNSRVIVSISYHLTLGSFSLEHLAQKQLTLLLCANTAYTAQAKFVFSIKCGVRDDKPFCACQIYLVAVILPPSRSAHAHAHAHV